MGLRENFEDRIDMAFLLKKLEIKSIPINVLIAIKGTPFEKNKRLTSDEIIKICAIYRFINPDTFIRLAGGRILTNDNGKECFLSGSNAVISGDMLTTTGTTIETDKKLIKSLGYEI